MAMAPGIGLPRDISVEGWRIDLILHLATVFAVGLAVVSIGWLIWSALLHRDGPPQSFRGESWRGIAIPLVLAALVFTVVDGTLFVRSTMDLDALVLRAQDEVAGAQRVEVNARQWAWDVRYAGADGRFASDDDVVLTGELRVPVGRPVLVELGSADVVHALYLPNVRVKRDAIPGRLTRAWFTATEIGRYEIACAQHCGVGHYKMRGHLVVMSPEDFESWLRAAQEDAERIAAEDRRARREEPTRGIAESEGWPALPPTRDWGWPWGGAP